MIWIFHLYFSLMVLEFTYVFIFTCKGNEFCKFLLTKEKFLYLSYDFYHSNIKELLYNFQYFYSWIN